MIVEHSVGGEVPETLLELFSRYNQDLWPAHVAAYLLAIPVVWALARPAASLRPPVRSRLPALVLGILLTWLGVVFQGLYATDISRPLGIAYAVLFVAGGLAMIAAGVRGHLLVDTSPPPFSRFVGLAASATPCSSTRSSGTRSGTGGRSLRSSAMAPRPTVIALFGVLALRTRARHLLGLPVAWTLLATLPAVERGVWEHIGRSSSASSPLSPPASSRVRALGRAPTSRGGHRAFGQIVTGDLSRPRHLAPAQPRWGSTLRRVTSDDHRHQQPTRPTAATGHEPVGDAPPVHDVRRPGVRHLLDAVGDRVGRRREGSFPPWRPWPDGGGRPRHPVHRRQLAGVDLAARAVASTSQVVGLRARPARPSLLSRLADPAAARRARDLVPCRRPPARLRGDVPVRPGARWRHGGARMARLRPAHPPAESLTARGHPHCRPGLGVLARPACTGPQASSSRRCWPSSTPTSGTRPEACCCACSCTRASLRRRTT